MSKPLCPGCGADLRSFEPHSRFCDRDQPADSAIVEALAAYAHEAWSGWMRHMWAKCAPTGTDDKQENGGMYVPVEWRRRWERQMHLSYADLREDEKESDRKEARRILAIIQASPAGTVVQP